MSNLKRADIKKMIDTENGIDYSRNINLSGYTVYRGNSFISFRIFEMNGVNVVKIDYIYVTNKKSLIKLLGWCINFWSGNCIKAIYYQEHKRSANYVEKYLPLLGFDVIESKRTNWKHDWTSTNGFAESEVIEAFI